MLVLANKFSLKDWAMAVDIEHAIKLFNFANRSRIVITGRERIARSKHKLQFILVSTDIAENSLENILRDFSHYPIVQLFTSEEFEDFFTYKNCKFIAFEKSDLAIQIYKDLKEARINKPEKEA